MSSPLEGDSDPTYTHFDHREEFLELLDGLIAIHLSREPSARENEDEDGRVKRLGAILDFYLPLPGILDPSLNEVVPPLMDLLSSALACLIKDEPISVSRLHRVGRVINWVIRVRGWKAVVPYFPSAIHHLATLVALLSPPTTPSSSNTVAILHHPFLTGPDAWELRAVLLLWLALLLTVPFNLSALSINSTASAAIDKPAHQRLFSFETSYMAKQVTLLSLPLLHRPGNEGAYAALVLARLYSRSDGVSSLSGFLSWAETELHEGDRESEANFVASLFVLLALLPILLAPQYLSTLASFISNVLIPHLRGSRTAADSGLVRKLAIKAKGRLWVAALKGKTQDKMPDGLEEQLDDLMSALSDKDTIVRYSSAKYLARLTSILPPSLSDEIILATIGLFAGTEDQPVIETSFGCVVNPGGTVSSEGAMGLGGTESLQGEARWHGCCLAIAEMARRGLIIDDEAIALTVQWALKALTFDLRRASHSIGANVRDAAAYLIWSLSRACPSSALEPHAEDIATTLTRVACFDREVGVRRAASAAFQEGVGRLGLYPEGIDVLGKTDFYSISVRRVAFTKAAAGVVKHDVYRQLLRAHLHHITLRHWDTSMRLLGGIALQDLLALGTPDELEDSISRELKELCSLDATNVHGGLVALSHATELLTPDDTRRQQIISAISTIRPAVLVSSQATEILQAACDLISRCLSPSTVASVETLQLFNQYLDASMKRREAECHEAAARMVGKRSTLCDATTEVNKLLTSLKSIRATQKQAATLALGYVQYKFCAKCVDKAVSSLLEQLEPDSKSDVETRRYAIRSLAAIIPQVSVNDAALVSGGAFQRMVDSFLHALTDYSTDQRGDVGSWIRAAGLYALGQAVVVAVRRESLATDLIPQDAFEKVVGGIVKQGTEKLEPVRAAAWRSWNIMQSVQADHIWQWKGKTIWMFDVKGDSDESFRYIDPSTWYSSAMPLLQTLYRTPLLAGLLHSIGSQVDSVASVADNSLKSYLEIVSANEIVDLVSDILGDLQSILLSNINQNRVFIPALLTSTKLFRNERIRNVLAGNKEAEIQCIKIIGVACRGVAQIKSIERISSVMKLVVASLSLPGSPAKAKAIDSLHLFLAHRFPRIRSLTAETVYLALSEENDDLDPALEEALLEPIWTEETIGKDEAERIVSLLRSA